MTRPGSDRRHQKDPLPRGLCSSWQFGGVCVLGVGVGGGDGGEGVGTGDYGLKRSSVYIGCAISGSRCWVDRGDCEVAVLVYVALKYHVWGRDDFAVLEVGF